MEIYAFWLGSLVVIPLTLQALAGPIAAGRNRRIWVCRRAGLVASSRAMRERDVSRGSFN